MLVQLGRGPASVSGLAAHQSLSLAAVGKYLRVLEASGLVVSAKEGRGRIFRIRAEGLTGGVGWATGRQLLWERRLQRLGAFLGEQSNSTKETIMKERSITHATFVVERVYPVSAKRVFQAWADPNIKRLWFGDPDAAGKPAGPMDFRVGGRESNKGEGPGGQIFTFDALYQDIVPDQRIIYSYDMTMNGERISVSVASIEFKPEGKNTRMTVTEQGAYLDGIDTPAQREEGTNFIMDQLGKVLSAQ